MVVPGVTKTLIGAMCVHTSRVGATVISTKCTLIDIRTKIIIPGPVDQRTVGCDCAVFGCAIRSRLVRTKRHMVDHFSSAGSIQALRSIKVTHSTRTYIWIPVRAPTTLVLALKTGSTLCVLTARGTFKPVPSTAFAQRKKGIVLSPVKAGARGRAIATQATRRIGVRAL